MDLAILRKRGTIFSNSLQIKLEVITLSYINSLALVLCVHLSLLSVLLTCGTVYRLLLILVHSALYIQYRPTVSRHWSTRHTSRHCQPTLSANIVGRQCWLTKNTPNIVCRHCRPSMSARVSRALWASGRGKREPILMKFGTQQQIRTIMTVTWSNIKFF